MPRATCHRCRRPAVACICALVPRVAHRTGLLVVQHPRERSHPFGTLRIARLALPGLRIDVASRDTAGRTRSHARPPTDAALLFPGAGVPDVASVTPPGSLVILDGTWPQARKLLRDNPWIAALPRVALRDPPPGRYRIRRAPRPGQLSTIEALVRTLRILEPENAALEELLWAFDRMIDRQLELASGSGSQGRERGEQLGGLDGHPDRHRRLG